MSKHALCGIQNCNEPALYAFTWAWGESGYCCGTHAVTLRHRAQALGRECQLNALKPGAPSPVTKDERVQMHARLLATEDENSDLKLRNLALFQGNEELTREIRRSHTELAELRSQLEDVRAELEQVTSEKMAALKQLSETDNERARLQGVLAAANTPLVASGS
jgi:uncharacterized membrane protein YccC